MALWKDQTGRETAASEPAAVLKAPEKAPPLAAVSDLGTVLLPRNVPTGPRPSP